MVGSGKQSPCSSGKAFSILLKLNVQIPTSCEGNSTVSVFFQSPQTYRQGLFFLFLLIYKYIQEHAIENIITNGVNTEAGVLR